MKVVHGRMSDKTIVEGTIVREESLISLLPPMKRMRTVSTRGECRCTYTLLEYMCGGASNKVTTDHRMILVRQEPPHHRSIVFLIEVKHEV